MNRETTIDYLNQVDRVYIVDAYAGWDPTYRYKIRIVCTRAYHALFMLNMLIRPTEAELATFGEPDFVIYNAGRCFVRARGGQEVLERQRGPAADGGVVPAALHSRVAGWVVHVCTQLWFLSHLHPPPPPAQAAPLPTGMPPTPPTPPRRSTCLWSTTRWSSLAPSMQER